MRRMKHNFYSLIILVGFGITFTACSSSPSSETDEIEESMKQEAGTDAVPQEGIEVSSASSDGPGGELKAPESGDTAPDPFQTERAPSSLESNDRGTSTSFGDSDSGSEEAIVGPKEKYMVQSGDTLMKIAFETYGDLYRWKKIFQQNRSRVKNPNSLVSGATLYLEKPSQPTTIDRNGEKHLIRSGDTLGTISTDVYGKKSAWRKLWENNRQLIRDPNKIFAGFYLYYLITPEERQETERLKGTTVNQSPLASSGGNLPPGSKERLPASTGMPPQSTSNSGLAPSSANPTEKKN